MKNLTLAIFILNFTKVFSQNSIPEFEFQLVIENNLMHSDSIELGYDKNADAIIDLKFGELDISKTPIRNTLDIRYSFDITSDFHLKRSINIYNCAEINPFLPPPGYPSGSLIGFYSNSYPVTIKWDKSKFSNDSCRLMSFITRINWGTFDFFEPWQLPKVEAYLADVDSLVLTKEYLEQSNYAWWARRNYYEVPLVDSTKGIFYMIYLGITGKPLTILLDNEEINFYNKFEISPNPSTNTIKINAPENGNISIFSLAGTALLKSKVNLGTNQYIDISQISSGCYILKFKGKSGRSLTKKLIKVN